MGWKYIVNSVENSQYFFITKLRVGSVWFWAPEMWRGKLMSKWHTEAMLKSHLCVFVLHFEIVPTEFALHYCFSSWTEKLASAVSCLLSPKVLPYSCLIFCSQILWLALTTTFAIRSHPSSSSPCGGTTEMQAFNCIRRDPRILLRIIRVCSARILAPLWVRHKMKISHIIKKKRYSFNRLNKKTINHKISYFV